MSLLDDVSIVVTPNGYKAGELYAVIPSDGAADMDVTRATDATRVDANGLIEQVLANVPRIDYTGGGCPHILIEPQRTNTIAYSEDFSQSYWAKSGVTVSLETTIKSPNGGYNAYKISSGTSGNLNRIAGVTGQTKSIFVRTVSGTGTIGVLSYNGGSASTQNITEEWQRFDVLANSGDTDGTTFFAVDFRNSTLTEVLIFGAQVENGLNATSYIPTSGSTVTRNQDIISRDGIGSLVNSEEGVVFLEMAALINGGSYRSISLSDGTNTNVLEIDLAPTSNRLEVYFIINGVSYLSPNSYSIVQTDYNKIAFSWEENNLKLYVNGIELVNDLTATLLPNKFNRLKFSASNGSLPFNGKVKQLQVYTTALTDIQLTALTS
tara:strand:- start:143 stop:1279 length:1137 start_codon:yes stop_codon:yes gene_type:complete